MAAVFRAIRKLTAPIIFQGCREADVIGKKLFVNGDPYGFIIKVEVYGGSGEVVAMITDERYRLRAARNITYHVTDDSVAAFVHE